MPRCGALAGERGSPKPAPVQGAGGAPATRRASQAEPMAWWDRSFLGRALPTLVTPSSGTRFAALDGLRGMACLGVMFWHLPAFHHRGPAASAR